MSATTMRAPADRPRAAFGRWGYLVCYVPVLVPMLGWWIGRQAGQPALLAWLTPFLVFGVVPFLDAWIGEDDENPAREHEPGLEADRFYRALPALVPLVQAANLLFGGWAFSRTVGQGAAGVVEGLGIIASVGLVSGATGIAAAHELIHKPSRRERGLGGLLLTTVGYASYKLEHLYGHHRHVATSADCSTAKRGENAYRFVLRCLRENPRAGYRIGAERARQSGVSPWSWRNEMVGWTALTAGWVLLAAWLGGVPGVLFLAGQALVAIGLLELINFIEHYGLVRREDARGRPERVSPAHSWNTNHRLTNWLLFGLQRHADHHAHGARRYQVLRSLEAAPSLPFGYPTAMVVAAIPPLWRRVIHPRLDGHEARVDADLAAA